MPDATSTADKAAKSQGAASSELEQVMEHLAAIRDDFTSLASATAGMAAKKAKSQVRHAGQFAEEAAAKAATYRDAVSDKVKDHPLAAIGIAALAGIIISSIGRRH